MFLDHSLHSHPSTLCFTHIPPATLTTSPFIELPSCPLYQTGMSFSQGSTYLFLSFKCAQCHLREPVPDNPIEDRIAPFCSMIWPCPVALHGAHYHLACTLLSWSFPPSHGDRLKWRILQWRNLTTLFSIISSFSRRMPCRVGIQHIFAQYINIYPFLSTYSDIISPKTIQITLFPFYRWKNLYKVTYLVSRLWPRLFFFFIVVFLSSLY